MGELSKKEVYYVVNHYIDTRQLLKKLNINVRANNAMFCPFHENTDTPAAHFPLQKCLSVYIRHLSDTRPFRHSAWFRRCRLR